MEFLFTHPPPNSFVIEAAYQQDKHSEYKSTPQDKEWKRMDLFDHKVYSSATLQLHVAN